ncbi:hypothetical protein ABK040_009825 [Willaertia magna]
MAANGVICCVGIIGKKNNPLFLKVYKTVDEEEPLKFHYIAHTALDIIEEKLSNRKNTNQNNDMYLGLLFPTEVFKIYGYITNSDVKLLLIFSGDDYQQVEKDNEIRTVFQQLHSLYIDCICNPFYTFEDKIESTNFESKVYNLVQDYNNQSSQIYRKSKKF